MRLGFGLLIFATACTSAPPPPLEPLTADSFAKMFIAAYVTPSPSVILPGIDLPLRSVDRVIANCAQAYAHALPEMTIDEVADFNANVTCVHPPQDTFEQSLVHYASALRERGFQDETRDYVQSGMRIACDDTRTVIIAIQANFVPPFMVDQDTGDIIDVPGGGELVNKSLAFSVSERPCGGSGR